MAFNIPKLEYKNKSILGNTSSGSPTISGIASTTGLEIGMFVKGAGIPSGATVLSVGVGTIGINANATAPGTGVALDLGFDLDFDFPPKEVKGETRVTSANVSESLSGVRQVSTNYIEATRNIVFSFLSQSKKESLDTFLNTWALLGFTFRYFEDKTTTTYVDYELDQLNAEPKIITGKGENAFIWELPLKFRRVL